MVQYKDLHKKTDDLFSKDWSHDSKAEVENNWKSGAFSFKNKLICPGAWNIASLTSGESLFAKNPSTVTEVNFETSDVAAVFKADTDGKANQELKFKQLGLPGLILNNKFSLGKGALAYEAVGEWSDTNTHCVLSVQPLKQQMVLSTAASPAKNLTVGGEVSGPLPTYAGLYRYSFGASFAIPEQNTVLGAKVTQDNGNTGITGFLHLTQGSTESAVQTQYTLGGLSTPTISFVTKQKINSDLSVKASINDALMVKASLAWKVSPLATASFGVAYATKADTKIGFKVVFA